MSARFNLVILLLLPSATTCLAQAAPVDGEFGQGPRPRQGHFFRVLDQDQDGQISAAEIDQLAAKLKAFDVDGDNFISRQELQEGARQASATRAEFTPTAGRARRAGAFRGGAPERGQFLDRIFQRDADGDGKLSGDELPQRFEERLATLDTNGDKAIDRDELQVIMEKKLQEHRGAGRPRGGVRGKKPDGRRGEQPASNSDSDDPIEIIEV